MKNLVILLRLILKNKNYIMVICNEVVSIFFWFIGFGGKIEWRIGRFKKW